MLASEYMSSVEEADEVFEHKFIKAEGNAYWRRIYLRINMQAQLGSKVHDFQVANGWRCVQGMPLSCFMGVFGGFLLLLIHMTKVTV